MLVFVPVQSICACFLKEAHTHIAAYKIGIPILNRYVTVDLIFLFSFINIKPIHLILTCFHEPQNIIKQTLPYLGVGHLKGVGCFYLASINI